jgi:ferric-dicitrate binding protein FerR (iron transport regulator)
MMSCDAVTPELFAYQLGASDLPLRDELDAHLLGCRDCLSAFLAHKRACEDGGAFEARPSDLVRARLRREVVARGPRRTTWVMVAAAAAVMIAAVWFALRPTPSSKPANELIDATSQQPTFT